MRLVGGSGRWSIETGAGVDCSIAVRVIRDDDDDDGPRLACFGLRAGCRGAPVSRVADGAAVNCESITVCAHASATHTEGVGHGSVERVPVGRCLPGGPLRCTLLTVRPEPFAASGDAYSDAADAGDAVVSARALRDAMRAVERDLAACRSVPQSQVDAFREAICIRTLPNDDGKRVRDYTGTNPAYLTVDAAALLADEWAAAHVVADLPSVDRERDGGRLLAHRILWGVPRHGRIVPLPHQRTITELAFFPDALPDGLHVLDLQAVNIESDAVPSRPILFPVTWSAGAGVAGP